MPSLNTPIRDIEHALIGTAGWAVLRLPQPRFKPRSADSQLGALTTTPWRCWRHGEPTKKQESDMLKI